MEQKGLKAFYLEKDYKWKEDRNSLLKYAEAKDEVLHIRTGVNKFGYEIISNVE